MAYCKKGKGVDLYTCIPLHTSQTIHPRTISTPWGASYTPIAATTIIPGEIE